MKEPTGDIEATLRYWQNRALDAEAEVAELQTELKHCIDDLRYAEGMLEVERRPLYD